MCRNKKINEILANNEIILGYMDIANLFATYISTVRSDLIILHFAPPFL